MSPDTMFAVIVTFLVYVICGIVFESNGVFSAVGISCHRLFLLPCQRRRFLRQLPDVLLFVANSLQAGFSLYQALELAASEIGPPVGAYLKHIVVEISLGKSLRGALEDWRLRIRCEELDLVVTAILVQRQLGGNLIEVLTRIAEDMRQKERIRGRVKTLTSQGRLTGAIVGMLPVFVLYAINVFNPEFGRPLLTTTLGKGLLVLAGTLELMGCFSIWRICRIRI